MAVMIRHGRPLPQLLDNRMIREEMGVAESTATSIMRRCELVRVKGIRRTFVRRADVEALLVTVPRPPEDANR